VQYLLAIFLPPLGLLAAGKPGQAVLSLILMITLIGWPIASIWAVLVVHGAQADARNKRLEKAIRDSGGTPPPSGTPPSGWPPTG
jgi:hypothetical protein